jgi:hypothetical protein
MMTVAVCAFATGCSTALGHFSAIAVDNVTVPSKVVYSSVFVKKCSGWLLIPPYHDVLEKAIAESPPGTAMRNVIIEYEQMPYEPDCIIVRGDVVDTRGDK